MTMPARFWKWRMHGGALTLSRRYMSGEQKTDCFLVTDMLDLTTFLALTRERSAGIPVVLFMHENQLTYPLPDDPDHGPMRRQRGERDLHYAFVNLSSMLAANMVIFNSEFHRRSLLAALPEFLRNFPEYNELTSLESIDSTSRVLPVGVDLTTLKENQVVTGDSPPLILWNHRWEYDKDPARFFAALFAVYDMGIPFRLALCGANFRVQPAEFSEARSRLTSTIVHYGSADEATYRRLLWDAAVTVSTARHEFFGVSTVEAIYCQTFPILPADLSYPEIIPSQFHTRTLYHDDEELIAHLQWALLHETERRSIASALSQSMARFDWEHVALMYDDAIENICLR